MPHRREVFLNNHCYHVFNKTIDNKRIFELAKNCNRFLETIRYYRSINSRIGFAVFEKLKQEKRDYIEKQIQDKKSYYVEVLAYCLLPNHFHFLLKQTQTGGVQRVISNMTNSITRFLNIKQERKGPYFLPRFHCVSIRGPEQLINVSRYIHLNPLASDIVSDVTALRNYSWSSYKDYVLDTEVYITNTSPILELFDNSKEKYRQFVEGIEV